MKNYIIKLLVLFVCALNVNAQESSVWEGDLYPKDFDKFKSGTYTSLNGDLRVYDSKVTDLRQLKSLTSVNGNVYIGIYDYKKDLEEGNKFITSLNGLDNLKEISGELEIRDNKLLENITALKRLKKVSKINISYNSMLTSLEGLRSVSGKIPHGLQIYKNKRLEDITQLAGITSVGDHLAINSNLSLKSLKGLHNIKAVEKGYLAVRSNTYLESLQGLDNIKAVDEDLFIATNPLIKNFKGLEKLSSVGERVYVSANEKLESLEGLASLKNVGTDFKIEQNNGLINLNGLKKLVAIGGDLRITENPLLSDINGLNTIKDSIKTIAIYKNESLKEITGLNKITAVKENVILSVNILDKATGFKGIKTIGEDFSMSFNQIKDISWFNNLEKVGEDFGIGTEMTIVDFKNSFKKLTHINNNFYLRSGEHLEHFSGLDAVVDIENVIITDNEKLISFSGFNGLKTIRGRMEVTDNALLDTFEGFNSLETISGRFAIEDNSMLEHIKGFENIDFIHYLWMDENEKLTDLSGFSNLKSANDIFIRRHFALEDLTGFNSLEKVNEELDIHYASSLTSLNGLENLKFLGKQLDLTDNEKLIDYNALQDSFVESITDKHLWITGNAYNPNKNQLLIHTKLDTKIIPEEYLKPQHRWWLSLLRNEIFARRGYAFGDGELKDYFNEQGWYQPEEGVEIVLNDIEEENVRLIKMYEQQQVDMAASAIQSLKKKYQDNIDFSSDYEKYYPVLRKFIKAIDVKSVGKSNKLGFDIAADVEGNWLGDDTGGMNDDDIDHIIIYFNHNKKNVNIRITDNSLVEDEYDSWTVNQTINFEFKINDDLTTEFSHVTGEYN